MKKISLLILAIAMCAGCTRSVLVERDVYRVHPPIYHVK